MLILGLNAYHGDSAACLVKDGRLVAAAEEERFRRIKHWAGFPSEAIAYCLDAAGLKLAEVAHVAVNHDPRASFWKKVGYALAKRPSPQLLLTRLKNNRDKASIADELAQAFAGDRFSGQVHAVEHHIAHLASSFLVSPFEEAAVVSVDGFGDFASACWGVGRGSSIEADGRVYFPHSLGLFYEAMTQFIGFPYYGEEYKVMGLAPYGEPRFMAEMRQIVQPQGDGTFRLSLDFFRHHSEDVNYTWKGGAPSMGRLFSPALEQLLGPARDQGGELTQRHRDIARSVQAMYEEAFFNLLRMVHARYRLDNLALAGGCAMNSVANGKIYSKSPFKRCYIQSAAGDAGGAIGAAFMVWQQVNRAPRSFVMDHAYWGPESSEAEVRAALGERQAELEGKRCEIVWAHNEDQLCQRTAQAISEGKVVGWFQGRMEWGPRALGNRSIVCDPRRADMKEILNRKIKRRESFRPFAPSILREAVPEWFETDDEVPFMMKVFPIRRDKRAMIPAVTHVDGSGRLQTVRRATNARYYRLIETFGKMTGVPLVLNTSFNENEPVVCRLGEALDCFLRTDMDLLVLGDCLIQRHSDRASN